MRKWISPVAPILTLSRVHHLDEFLELEEDDNDETNHVASLYVLFINFA